MFLSHPNDFSLAAHFSLFRKSVILVGQWNKLHAIDHLPFLKEKFMAWFHLSIYGFCSGRLIGIIFLPSACSSFDPHIIESALGIIFLLSGEINFSAAFPVFYSCGLFWNSSNANILENIIHWHHIFERLKASQFFKKIFIFTFVFGCAGSRLHWVFIAVFSSCGEWGLLFIPAWGLLTAVASLVAECALVVSAHKLSICSSQALECWLSSCGTLA